jgi:hypothetical protein
MNDKESLSGRCSRIRRRLSSQLGDLFQLGPLDSLDHELGDLLSTGDVDRLCWIEIDEEDLELAAVAGVDDTGGVRERESLAQSAARPRVNEACKPLRNGDRKAGWDDRALPRFEHYVLCR